MEWKVTNALSRDVERQQLNKILKEIRETIAAIQKPAESSGSSAAPIFTGGVSSNYNPTTGEVEINPTVYTLVLSGDVSGSARVTGKGNVNVSTELDPALIGVEEAPIDNQNYWRRNGEWEIVPDAVLAVADIQEEGLVAIVQDPDTFSYTWVMREIEGTTDEIDVADGDAIAGNPIISLADLADTGTGTFKLLTRDSKGRLEGTEDGDAADVPYNNTTSGLTADDVQEAIDELSSEKLDDAPSDGSEYVRKDGAWEVASNGGTVDSVVAGTGISVDSTDPANPIITATGGGGSAFDPRTSVVHYQDFLTELTSSTNTGTSFLQTATPVVYTGGGGSGNLATSTFGTGVVNLHTNSGSTAYARLWSTGGALISLNSAGGIAVMEQRFYINALSNGTNRYSLICGLYDMISGTNSDSITARYTDTSNGGMWFLYIQNGGVANSFNTSIAYSSPAYTTLRFEMDQTAGTCDLYIDGVFAVQGTGIPTGVGLGMVTMLTKGLGTTDVICGVDYHYFSRPR